MMAKILSAMVILGFMGPAYAMGAGSDELWEMTTSMSMRGMDMPAMKHNICQTRDSAYKPEKTRQQKNCEITDIRISGNRTTWKMHCSGKDAMSGSGEVTKKKDKMDGVMKLAMRSGEMTQLISGKRIGNCQAK